MVPLCSAELLMLRGRDAVAFAHAQFTSDVAALAPGDWQWSAWLDAQGRTRNFFALLRLDSEGLAAWLPLGGVAQMREALARYVFRASVTLQAHDWTLLDAGASTTTPAAGRFDPRDGGFALALPGPRIALIAPVAGVEADADALEAWRRADVDARLPLLAPSLAGEFVPQALDLERHDAIRFDKGCYPGQEVAARLHFRGGNKRHLQRLRITGAPPACGDTMAAADGAAAGRILHAARDGMHSSIALGVVVQGAPVPYSVAGSDVVLE